jgi:hypothetical protein
LAIVNNSDPISIFNEIFSVYLGTLKVEADLETTKEELDIIADVSNRINEMLSGRQGGRRVSYYLGLVVDFCLLVERCLQASGKTGADQNRDEKAFFRLFPLIEKRGQTQANTLTVKFREGKDGTCGIRKIEELLISYFERIQRVGYPNAYVYNTGQWHKYQDTLGNITRLSSEGRRKLLHCAITRALDEFDLDPASVATDPIWYPHFSDFVANYPRSNPPAEHGGLVLQAMCYAYLAEVYRNYSVVASSVRTGSSRQKRIGDIDIYDGHSLIASCEVKDLEVNSSNFDNQMLRWKQQATRLKALPIAACASVSREIMDKHSQIDWLPLSLLTRKVADQDLESRARMTSRFLHYLIIIERNPKSLQRAKDYILNRRQELDSAE